MRVALVFLLLLMGLAEAQEVTVPTAKVQGVVLERGTKRALSDVNVFILPHKLKATTDAQGRFSFDSVPFGEFQFVVNLTNYKKYEVAKNLTLDSLNEGNRILLERTNYQVFEITVRDRAKKRDDTTRTMKAEQFLTVPGANGDPVKAVQNLPGVSRAQGFSSQVVIQGSAPKDTSYLMDSHDVPLIFHFGGLTSVITPEAIEQVDYLSAGYGPEYGRALGGLVGLKTRDPSPDQTKGFAFVDIFKSGGLVEGPLNDSSSYLLTARYSYLGFILAEAAKKEKGFDLTVAPSFGDFAGIYKKKLSETDELKVLTILSHDELKFVLNEPLRTDPSLRGNFSNSTDFFRIIPQWQRRIGTDEAYRVSFGLGEDKFNVDAGDIFLHTKAQVVTHRAEWEKRFKPSWVSYLGLDARYARESAVFKVPNVSNEGGVRNPISSVESIERQLERDVWLLGPYWRNSVKVPETAWTLMPSLRLDYFSPTRETLPQPRLAARYDASPSLYYRAATGLYRQPPLVQELARGYGNPDLKSPSALHYTAGFDKDFRGDSSDGFTLQASLFLRTFDHLVVRSTRTIDRDGVRSFENYNNEGSGRAYGTELLLRYDHKPWSGWLAYTLSRSTRQQPGQSEYVFEYDQTHNINLVGAYETSGNWRYSSRLRYVSGNPYTPVTGGVFDADNDVYLPVRGGFYSQRLSSFVQLDVRVDKKWIFDSWILTAYLDVQNATNRKNTESIGYSYDFSERQDVTGLPLLPTFGLRGDF